MSDERQDPICEHCGRPVRAGEKRVSCFSLAESGGGYVRGCVHLDCLIYAEATREEVGNG